jgi:hypothetical protein
LAAQEPQAAPDPEEEREHAELMGRVDALVQISRKERDRLEKLQDQTPGAEGLQGEL